MDYNRGALDFKQKIINACNNISLEKRQNMSTIIIRGAELCIGIVKNKKMLCNICLKLKLYNNGIHLL